MADLMVRVARGSARRMLITTSVGGFVTSMWMALGLPLAGLLVIAGSRSSSRSFA